MGKIKQGILGGFKGKVGTVIGASWNGIAYMKGLPQSQKDPKTAAQLAQRNFFREVQDLVGQLTAEQLAFLFPSSPTGMTRRNAIVQQFCADPLVEADGKHVDLANINSLGNAPTADMPDVSVAADGDNLAVSWDGDSDFRTEHGDEYPTIFVANVTKKRSFWSIPPPSSAARVPSPSMSAWPPTAKPPTPSAALCWPQVQKSSSSASEQWA